MRASREARRVIHTLSPPSQDDQTGHPKYFEDVLAWRGGRVERSKDVAATPGPWTPLLSLSRYVLLREPHTSGARGALRHQSAGYDLSPSSLDSSARQPPAATARA